MISVSICEQRLMIAAPGASEKDIEARRELVSRKQSSLPVDNIRVSFLLLFNEK
ncbi:MAG: hypothetical protein ACR652_23895 [Methylocystis sp.]|uniref:hypothetical protein n=1 Tax=Methylocystis sp. TaxID=1911079 RepID=UPI003DA3FF9C